MPKLTPTTNDAIGNGSLALQQGTTPQPIPVQFPSIPLPQNAKPGRKPKEQTVNIPETAPVAEPQPLKIALIGTAPSSRMMAPYNDPTWKIWGCSPGNMNLLPRIDAWFEVHGTNLYEPENKSYAAQYIEWLKNLKVPLYMQDQRICPNAITIPVPTLIQEFWPVLLYVNLCLDDGHGHSCRSKRDRAVRNRYGLA